MEDFVMINTDRPMTEGRHDWVADSSHVRRERVVVVIGK